MSSQHPTTDSEDQAQLMRVLEQHVTGFLGSNHSTNDYSVPFIRPALATIYPLFIVQYATLAVFSILANVLMLYYIVHYKLYRDCTHAFLANLSVAHLVQSAAVLPFTLVVMLVQNWIYGQFMCFFLPLLQDIPMHVAILSHLLIAFDRMRWLADPLRSRLPSFVCCCATWLTGMIIALPYPIYTTYIDLEKYAPKFRGVGICAVNLIDDMQEYMRGLFVIMYCAPATILAYLYIRTSRELRPPEGPMSVMMCEQREAANRQRASSNTPSATRTGTRTNYARSYDLYDAELDVTREKRTQRHLGAMAAAHIICICPLMIIRCARMLLDETYANTTHFDFTYLLFVWMAFLPVVINPGIYAIWVLSRTMKERLRGYFRLSSRSCDNRSETGGGEQRSSDVSITQDATTTTETADDRSMSKADAAHSVKSAKNHNHSEQSRSHALRKTFQGTSKVKCGITRSTEVRPNLLPTQPTTQRLTVHGGCSDSHEQLNNSCSNITASTYCNNGDATSHHQYKMDQHADRDRIHENPISEPASGRSERIRSTRTALRSRPMQSSQESDLDSILSRRESTSTFERDMDIIDLLQRQRSMELPDALEQERRGAGLSVSRQNSASERHHHRRLPDLRRLAASPQSPNKKSPADLAFPNQVFTHLPPHLDGAASPLLLPSGRGVAVVAAAVAAQSQRAINQVKRDSMHSVLASGSDPLVHTQPVFGMRPDRRDHRLASSHSGHSTTSARSSSLKGRRLNSRSSCGESSDLVFDPNL